MQSKKAIKKAKIGRIVGSILIIILLSFISMIAVGIMSLSMLGSSDDKLDTIGNVALIKIAGTITTSNKETLFGEIQGTSSDKIIETIDKIIADPKIEAIILEVNSGGGSGVAADEISYALKRAKKHNITIVAYIREIGASAAYWIASESNYIIANKMSFVGSIGVLSGFVDVSGLLNDYNISYERFVAGKYKDFGTSLRPVTDEERDLFQAKLDGLHHIFIQEVANNRNMTYEDVEALATGMVFTSYESLENGLIDSVGHMDDAISYLENKNITVDIREYSTKSSLLSVLLKSSQDASYNTGRGIGDSLVQNSGRNIAVW